MQKNFTLKGALSLCLIICFISNVSAQHVTASPANIIRPFGPNTVSVFLNRHNGGWGGANAGTYAWTVTPANGVTIGAYSQTSPVADVNVTFSSAASGSYTFTLTRGSHSASVTVTVGNIAACSSDGNTVSEFSVVNGGFNSGPGEIFSPAVTTAALGLSTNGYFYYMPRNFFGNHGNVTVYAAKPDGSNSTAIASIDLNGSSNNDLGFVRMAIDPTGTGWLLAGDDNTLYLAKFIATGINATTITVVDPSVTLVNGAVTTFRNGDICFSGTGTLYAMANVTNGPTQIFIGTPNGTSTTLTKKWDLVNQNGNNFTGTVNGVAFDALGSLYISTSTGLYYINQTTVNTATGTVQCTLVRSVSGLTDLASNFYPALSSLPLRLLSFSGNYRSQHTLLTWETTSEQNVRSFDIERSSDGNVFAPVGSKSATGNNATTQDYQFNDDLSNTTGSVFFYRLKMIDNDGIYKYSNVIAVHKDEKTIKSITINPNPVINGMATVRFSASVAGNYDCNVVTLSGQVVLHQQNKVLGGNNSISILGLDRLTAGIYVLEISNGDEIQSVKFVAR